MAAKFPNADLVACSKREAAMRRAVYPKREGKDTIADCSKRSQNEHAMMEAITEQLEALPTLLERYQQQKDEVARLQQQLTTIRAMATRSVPNCINLDAIDRILNEPVTPTTTDGSGI